MNTTSRLTPTLLCAAAALALPAAAQAQSNVSLYGLIDLSVGEFQTAGNSQLKTLGSGN